jgi:hypothetical protein
MRFCPVCGSTLQLQQAAVQAAVPAKNPKVKRWVIRGAIIGVLVVGVGAFLDQLLRTYHPVIESQPDVAMVTMYRDEQIRSTPVEAVMIDGKIGVPLRSVQEHKIVRFVDPERQLEVPMIAYITPQGKLVTAISKSEQCGSTDFYLSGNNIHCASCGSYWNMASMEAYACCQRFFPDPVPSSVSGDMVVIEPAAVRSWRSRL